MKGIILLFTLCFATACVSLQPKKNVLLHLDRSLEGVALNLTIRDIYVDSEERSESCMGEIRSSAETLLLSQGEEGLPIALDLSLRERIVTTGSGVSRRSETCGFLEARGYADGSEKPLILYIFTESGNHSLSEGYYLVSILKRMIHALRT